MNNQDRAEGVSTLDAAAVLRDWRKGENVQTETFNAAIDMAIEALQLRDAAGGDECEFCGRREPLQPEAYREALNTLSEFNPGPDEYTNALGVLRMHSPVAPQAPGGETKPDPTCPLCSGTGHYYKVGQGGPLTCHLCVPPATSEGECDHSWVAYVQAEHNPIASMHTGENNIARYVKIGEICDQCGVAKATLIHPAESSGGDAVDAARYRRLRDSSNCSMTISHNDHHFMYLSVADTLDDSQGYYDDVPEDERAAMIATDTIWTLHIYQNTPVGFNVYHGATLDAVVDAAIASGADHG